MKYILSCDPGLNGCFCLYRKDEPLILIDMPILEITRNGTKKHQIDLYALANIIDKHSTSIEKAFIENPQGMPGMASNATYRLGLNCGIAQMAIAANFIPMTLVAPATWKKSMGLSKDKDACRLIASQNFPNDAHNWARKKDDGRAESALLALWGSRQVI